MNEKNKKKSSNSGISFLSMLGIVFIVLKLTGYVTWPWIAVLAPLWIIPAALAIFFFVWMWFIK